MSRSNDKEKEKQCETHSQLLKWRPSRCLMYSPSEKPSWPGPEVIKLFFILNSVKHEYKPDNIHKKTRILTFFFLNRVEHEIYSANKY